MAELLSEMQFEPGILNEAAGADAEICIPGTAIQQ